MKLTLLLTIFLLFIQISFAQRKLDEYEITHTDQEQALIDHLLSNLLEDPESRGLIVIYSGEKEKELSAALRHIEGIKVYLSFRTVTEQLVNRISFQIKEGKKPLFKELWVYPKEATLPVTAPKQINLDNLKTKYLYASVCSGCEYEMRALAPDFRSLGFFSGLLKRYLKYKGLIIIYPSTYENWSRKENYKSALKTAVGYRNSLVNEEKIDNNRISIRIGKKPTKKDQPEMTSLYIVPR